MMHLTTKCLDIRDVFGIKQMFQKRFFVRNVIFLPKLLKIGLNSIPSIVLKNDFKYVH